jgi:hypothetical protein
LLVEGGTADPVWGAFVILLDDSEREVSRVLSNEEGAFSLTARRPGLYKLRTERIGYASTVTAEFPLAAGETRSIQIEVPVDAIRLDELRVESERRCVIRPEEGIETARVWEEARKALSATRWAEAQQEYVYHMRRYQRQLDLQTRVILSEESEVGWRTGVKPFTTPTAANLMTLGFVQVSREDTSFYAPDADVLLSDEFLDSHCFRVRFGDGDRSGLVGLAFEPVAGRDVSDVRGTLWLDQETAALLYIEYRYTAIDLNVERESFGGRLDFDQLPNGRWIVRRWWIRGPIFSRPTAGRAAKVVAIKQVGGEVIAVRPAANR